ncbi:MAG: phenylalanine--tRNA ligase subunit beta, partial [Oscillospiraceae bacterium]|nr:phenylalanine--tRNA ligase subunit beta [Oscillospiraceae bacterium]
MKLNREWINSEFVDLSAVSDKEYVEKLTVFGQKVETYERMDAEIKNVKQGDLVPACLHNSWLPGGVHITKGKLRGVKSNGMLCSFLELGLTQNDMPGVFADGIWILNDEDCKPGDDINDLLGNRDTVVEFEITNNRPDCYSIIGLARESAAAFGKTMRHHEPVVKGSDAGSIFDQLDVEVPAEDKCYRYTARMVKNVKIGPSPKWLR